MTPRDRMTATMPPAGIRPRDVSWGCGRRSLRAEILILTARINFNP
jgi:hypothetical protein